MKGEVMKYITNKCLVDLLERVEDVLLDDITYTNDLNEYFRLVRLYEDIDILLQNVKGGK